MTTFRADYSKKRAQLLTILRDARFSPTEPDGSYFILADFSARSQSVDTDYAKELVVNTGVAAIPPSVFYASEKPTSLLRFAFCKNDSTLKSARERLCA